MSTSARELDPNDPRLTQVLYSPSDPPKYNNPIALAVHAAGFHRRALRIEDCGKYKSRKCVEGHITRHHRFCETRSCNGHNCAELLAADLVNSFELAASHAIINAKNGYIPSRFTFVDFRFKCSHNRKAIYAQTSEVIEHMMRLRSLSKEELTDGSIQCKLNLLTYAAGLDDSGLLVIRIFFYGSDVDPEEFRERFGAVSADVHIVPMQSIHRFMPLLFAVIIPKSDSLRAAMEIAFIGIRRLRTIGHFDRPELEELSVEEGDGKPSTDNSALADADSSPDTPLEKQKLCPICHKRIIAESGWMPAHLPPPLPERITFYPSTS
jgi:hypothetical protein